MIGCIVPARSAFSSYVRFQASYWMDGTAFTAAQVFQGAGLLVVVEDPTLVR